MIEWLNVDRSIILASGSPRRKLILEQMGFTFEIVVPKEINEKSYLDQKNLTDSIQNLAFKKAEQISHQYPNALVLGADTIVVKDSEVLGKPVSRQNAFDMLNILSGCTHTVITGVAILCLEEHYIKTTYSCTEVQFRPLTKNEIESYLDTDEYLDKAGSYAIQGKAMVFVEKISGCYYNVVGLPVTSTIKLFKDFTARKESADV